jgi:hypothetical protein
MFQWNLRMSFLILQTPSEGSVFCHVLGLPA